MNHKNNTEYPSMEENENSWFGSNLYRLMLIVTLVWFAIVLIYITQFFGWSNLFLMMPDEFGGFLAGATLPLALIWVGMAYVDRSAAFKKEAKFLRAYMNQLVYPEEGESATAKAMSEAIRGQVAELREVTKLAMSQTSSIKKELDARVDDFASLVRVLDNYSTKSIVELTNGLKTLTKSFDGVTDKAFKTTKDLNECIKEFSSVANRLQEDINGVVDNLLPGMHEIKNSADIIQSVAESSSKQIIEASDCIRSYGSVSEENFNLVYEKIQAQSKYLENITSQAVESTKAVGETFRSVAEEIDILIETRGRKTVEYAENMDDSIQTACRQIAEHSNDFVNEAEKIIAQTSIVENNISTQAHELKNIADTLSACLHNTETSLNTGFENMDERSSQVIDKLREAVDIMQMKTENLITFAKTACDKLNESSGNIDEQFEKMQKIGDKADKQLKESGQRFEIHVKDIDKSVASMVEKLNQVNTVLSEQSEKISETGNMAITQSRLAENSLSEQHNNINASLTMISNIRTELSSQIDELKSLADKVSEQTNHAVNNLQENMAASLAASNDVAEQSKKINDAMENEVQRLGEAAEKATSKISSLENAIIVQKEQLMGLSDNIEEHTTKLSEMMEKHTDAVNEATDGFSKQFAEIVSTFETQSQLFNNISENTVGVSRSLRDQIASIGESADSVFAKITTLEEEVARRGSDVADKSKVAIDKLSEIDQAVSEQINRINENMDIVANRLHSSIDEFVNGLNNMQILGENTTQKISSNIEQLRLVQNDFGHEFDDLSGKMGDYSNRINGSIEIIRSQSLEINDNFNAVLEQMQNQEKRISEVFHIISEQMQTRSTVINDNFVRQREDLLDVVNQVSAQTRLGEVNLNRQYKCLADISESIAEKIDDLSRRFEAGANYLRENTADTSASIEALSDQLVQADKMLGQTKKNAVTSMQEVGEMLSSCTEHLNRSTNDAAAYMNKITQDYKQNLSAFQSITNESGKAASEATALIASENEKMLKISNDTQSLADYFSALMEKASEQLIEKANDAHDKIRAQGEELQKLGSQLEETIAASSNHFNDCGEKLKSVVSDVMTDAHQLTEDINTSGNMFKEHAQTLWTAANETLSKANEVSASLAEFTTSSNKIITGIDRFNDVVKKQIDILEIGAKQAGGELADIEKRYREMKVENFLKNATSVIEKLENLAVDINVIFNPESQDKLWQKYYEGDVGVFARYLSRTMNRKQVVAIKEEFEKNPEFRKVVSAYMREFEELINRARSCEKSDILLSVISGADIGKIYYVMARALDKLN